jgi:rhamnosyltransferase
MTSENLTANKIAALVITYMPDDKVLKNVRLLSREFSKVVIVDNGSNNLGSYYSSILNSIQQLSGVSVINLPENIGISSALNKGVRNLKDDGWEWVVTFDQDSIVSDDYLINLCESYNNFDTKPVIMGSKIVNRLAPEVKTRYVMLNGKTKFSLLKPDEDTLDVDIVITSGALTSTDFICRAGWFMDSYFIDYVDTEICLRAKSLGYHVAFSSKAVIYHELGNKKTVKRLGFSFCPTNHAPFRRYYIARNSIDMYKRFFIKYPSWVLYDLLATTYNAVRIFASEDNVLAKARCSIKGYYHGLLGRFGKMPD